MPELSRFFGIVIRMYYSDHPPPHFHAIYNNQEVQEGLSTMFPRIIAVKYVQDYVLALTFADGRQATMDFTDKIVGRGGVFTPLEDIHFFAQVTVDPEAGTLVWPNGVDLDPDVLYSEATGTPLPLPEKA